MSKQLEKIIYKILVDILSLSLLVFFLNLIFEGVVPGYISGHLSFTKLIIFIVVIILGIAYLGKRNRIWHDASLNHSWKKNKITVFLVIVGLILIINSLFRLGWFESLVVVAATAFILYSFFQILFFAEKD
ncbi:MAG: hypothetical protein WCX17_04800 [Parcubacteria group bacterium]|jgi:hypothetical protein